jgi:hypothetical protein
MFRQPVRPVCTRLALICAAATGLMLCSGRPLRAAGDKTWAIKADYIEACSCSLFCSCYFNTGPEGGSMCEFNNAVKIAEGHVGDVKVDGAKFWLSGDLGGDFTKGMKSAVITLEPNTTKEQEKAIVFLVTKVYPVKWKSVAVDRAPIVWEKNGVNGHAKLGNGKGEVTLKGVTDGTGQQTVIRNLKYWGAQKNNGFYLAKGTHRYKGHGHNYSHKDRNGFFIHIESSGSL